MSYISILYHIVISTKNREMSIPIEHDRELYAYMWKLISTAHVKLFRIGGMPDHIHLLVSIPPSIKITDFIRDLKTKSNYFLRRNQNFPSFHGWGSGYGLFTKNMEDKQIVLDYIKNQKVHHQNLSFQEELKKFILENGGTPEDAELV